MSVGMKRVYLGVEVKSMGFEDWADVVWGSRASTSRGELVLSCHFD